MKNKKGLSERHFFRESHLITNSKASYSKNEIDLILSILSEIDKNDTDFKEYTFSIQDLEVKTGRDWSNTKQLRETAKALMSKVLEIKINENKWSLYHWFDNFKYDNGIIKCSFHKDLKPYLLKLQERFIISNLKHLLPMNSSYSKRIYMLLKEYAKFGSRKFDLRELQELLKTPKSYNINYSKFKQAVINQAIIDINKFSDLKIKVKEIKLSRKVIAIDFEIKRNDTDLKAFIEWIRTLHVNEDLLYCSYNKNEILKCSEKGMLYEKESLRILDKKAAAKEWHYLFERQEKLIFKMKGLFD